jgi:hypothetical protein
VLGRFDESGALTASGQQIGTVRLDTGGERSPSAAAGEGSLAERVLAGRPVVIRFEGDACRRFDLGTIACDSEYRGAYERRAQRWVFTDHHRSEGAVATFAHSIGEPAPGSLSLWGMVCHVDDAGTLLIVVNRSANSGSQPRLGIRIRCGPARAFVLGHGGMRQPACALRAQRAQLHASIREMLGASP